VMRASAAAESAGVPSVALVCEGFVGQANTTSIGLGLPYLQLAPVPGHVDVQSVEEPRRNIVNVTVEAVIKGLTGETNRHTLWSAKTLGRSSSTVEETVLVVKSIQDAVRDHAAGPIEAIVLRKN
jgi:hypothetical protein